MDLQDFLAPQDIRIWHDDLPIETARTQQRGVKHVRTVRGGDEDDPLVRLEPVHLDEKLVQRLLALVIAATETSAAMPADRVDFVDEDDARRILFGLLEHVPDAARADPHEHFYEVRPGDREERHARLAGDGSCQKRFACAGRADEQDATGNAASEPLEFLRIAEKLHDLLQILLCLIDAGDILERHAPMRFGQKLRLRLAKSHRLAGAALHLPGEEEVNAEKGKQRKAIDQKRHQPGITLGRRTRCDRDVLGIQLLHERRIVRRVGRERATVA